MLFVGDDWAEAHHDVEIQDDQGRLLARRRLPEGIGGMTRLHELVADHLGDDGEPQQVLVGIETDRGPWVAATPTSWPRSSGSTEPTTARCPVTRRWPSRSRS